MLNPSCWQVRHAPALPKSVLLDNGELQGVLSVLINLVKQPPRALATQLGGASKATAKLHSRAVAALCEVAFCMAGQPKLLASAWKALIWVLRVKVATVLSAVLL